MWTGEPPHPHHHQTCECIRAGRTGGVCSHLVQTHKHLEDTFICPLHTQDHQILKSSRQREGGRKLLLSTSGKNRQSAVPFYRPACSRLRHSSYFIHQTAKDEWKVWHQGKIHPEYFDSVSPRTFKGPHRSLCRSNDTLHFFTVLFVAGSRSVRISLKLFLTLPHHWGLLLFKWIFPLWNNPPGNSEKMLIMSSTVQQY